MKKILLLGMLIIVTTLVFSQQRYVFVDTEYILNQIPEYQLAQDALNNLSKEYEKKIENADLEIKELKSKLTAEELFLSPEMREKRHKAIKEKEFLLKKMQQDYFGANGALYKKRRSLVQPIQEKIYNAVEKLAREGNYGMVIDQAAAPVILWSQPKYDKSDKIVETILGKGVSVEE